MANILVFGDSISFGCYDEEGGWVDRLKRYCLKEDVDNNVTLNRYVYNLSISGDTSKEIVKRMEYESIPRSWNDRPTVFIFALGLNDSILINGNPKTHERDFKNNILRLINNSRKHEGKIIFAGPALVDELKVSPMPWSLTEVWQNKRIRTYNNIMKRVCYDQKVDFLEMTELFNNNNFNKYLLDGAHPNTKGHELIYKTVKDYLQKKEYI